MTPISVILAFLSAAAIPNLPARQPEESYSNGEERSDSVPAKVLAASEASDENKFSPVLTLDEVTAMPSPEAWAMSRHLEEGIDHATGTGTLSIPLYSWDVGDLRMELGLRYRLGAYKVRERAGWVGLGWSLTGGGCVSREIVGLPDEKYSTPIKSAAQIRADSEGHKYLQEVEEYRADSGLDRYSYSCPGAEGSFVIVNGKIVQTPGTDNKIEFTGTGKDGVRDFLVTTPDGTKYYFTEREKTAFRSIPSSLSYPMFLLSYQDAVSAWHLTRIESPGGTNVATFTYSTLASWQRSESFGGEYVDVTWCAYPQSNYPLVSTSSPEDVRSGTLTTFPDQKLLKTITTRTARVEFKTQKEASPYANDTPEMLTEVKVYTNSGTCVREITLDLECPSNSPRMLKGVRTKSEEVLLDSHDFSYIADTGGGRDFFGYRNNGNSERRTVIDMQTGKMNSDIATDPSKMRARAMWRHRTGTGITTLYSYEPSTVSQSRNGKTYNITIGLRIKKIAARDTVTGRVRTRAFTYSSPACDIDFTELDAGCFAGLSGGYYLNTLGVKEYYNTTLTLYDSSRLVGFLPEKATIYYGAIEEDESGTDVPVPVKTRYEYDTGRCDRKFIQSQSPDLRLTDQRRLTFGNISTNFPQAFKDAMQTGSFIPGSFTDGIGHEPRLAKKIGYEYSGSAYCPRRTDRYFHITVDSSLVVTGNYHESGLRECVAPNGVRRKEYSGIEVFCYGNSVLSCSGSLVDSVSSTIHFLEGGQRVSTTRYLYSGSTRMPLPSKSIIIDNPGRIKNEFLIDSIHTANGPRTCYGIRTREGGHVTEHYKAYSGMLLTAYFTKVNDAGQRLLPVREIWVVDRTDTITRTWEYGLFSGAYRPTVTRLYGKKGAEMDRVRIKGYTAYGYPTGSERRGKPDESYTWGYGGDLLTKLTVSGGSLSLSTSFTHSPLVGCTSRTDPDGSVTSFTYKAGRLASGTNGNGVVVDKYSYSIFGDGTTGLNTITTEKRVNDSGSATSEANPGVTMTVYDGFGLPVSVSRKNFGSSGDVTEFTRYDGLHRARRKWMPLPVSDLSTVLSSDAGLSSVSSGLYSGDGTAYSEMTYPVSHEGRPSSVTLPGKEFRSHPSKTVFCSSRSASGKYRVQRFSLQGDAVKGGGYYSDGELDCEAHTDGNGSELLVFTDALGRTVLERRSAGAGKYADTYTISDSWGNPLVVLPPESSTLMTNAYGSWKMTDNAIARYAFIYTYDNALRLRSRTDAGVRKTDFAYDRDGRLAFSRESGQRVKFYTYDPLGREAVTGSCASEGRESLWTSDRSASTASMTMTRTDEAGTGFLGTGYTGTCMVGSPGDSLLAANYYDDHLFLYYGWKPVTDTPPGIGSGSHRGLVTGRLLATLSPEGRGSVLTAIYYMKGGVPVRTESDGPAGGITETISTTVAGLPLTVEKTAVYSRKKYSYTVSNAYDPYGRLKASHVAETGTGLGPLLAEISFDAAGNPSSYKTEGGYTKSVKRDIRGNVSSWTTPFMSQELGYGSQGSCSDWTGRVTCRTTTVGTVDRRYDYSYSPQGFLTSAKYSSKARPDDDFSATYAYDLNGNVTSAVRKSPDALSAKVSELAMSAAYEGNALSRLAGSDDASAPMESRMGINGIGSAAVTYDNAGRLSADAMRGISLITYNDIGMQELVATSQGDRALYSYLADGRKYGERCRSHDGTGNSQRVSMAGFEFGSMLLRFYDTPFGYYEPYNRVLYTYIHDYQGNIVGIIDTSKGKLVQQTDYYPYGMPHSDGTGAELNRRKFGAKELMTEFGIDMYNFEARFLGLPIPAFQTPDPLAYKTPHVSPYSYCHGDPVNFSDPTGQYSSKSEAMKQMEQYYPGAMVLLDNHSGQWYIALDENGKAAYESGGTLTKDFGRRQDNLANDILISELWENCGKVNSGFSTANSSKQLMIEKTAEKSLNGTANATLKGSKAVDKAFGKSIGNYFRVVKGFGIASTAMTIGISLIEGANYISNGGDNPWVLAKYSLDAGMSIIGWFGPIGFAISTTYFILDTTTDIFKVEPKYR